MELVGHRPPLKWMLSSCVTSLVCSRAWRERWRWVVQEQMILGWRGRPFLG